MRNESNESHNDKLNRAMSQDKNWDQYQNKQSITNRYIAYEWIFKLWVSHGQAPQFVWAFILFKELEPFKFLLVYIRSSLTGSRIIIIHQGSFLLRQYRFNIRIHRYIFTHHTGFPPTRKLMNYNSYTLCVHPSLRFHFSL